MKYVKVIFVTPNHGNFMDKVGSLVRTVTGSKWAHVAGYLLGGVYEAIMPEVMISPLDKYKHEECIEVLEVRVTNAEYEAIEAEAQEILAKDVKYGILDCIVGGANTLFGSKAAWGLAKLFRTDMDNTLVCVGLYGKLLLKCNKFADYAAKNGWYENNISWMVPQDLYTLILGYNAQQNYKKVG